MSLSYTRTGLRGLASRERNLETLDELEKSSVDFYATLRSAYRQNRAFEISNGCISTEEDEDALFDEPMD